MAVYAKNSEGISYGKTVKAITSEAAGMNVWVSSAATTTTSITLKWDSVAGADYYLIWNTSADSPILLGKASGDGTGYLIKDLKPVTEYTFMIAAYKMSGDNVSEDDVSLSSGFLTASTYGDSNLPLGMIMNEVTGGAPSAGGGNRIDLTGQITDENGLPLPGLTIELHSNPRTAVTDSNGWYCFDSVEEGEHTIYVYYGDTITETQLDLKIDRNESAEGIETLRTEDGCVEFKINEPNATLVLSLSMDDEGRLSIERLEAQPVVYLTEDGLAAGSNGILYFAWWIVLALVLVAGGIFFIVFKRRKKKEEKA